MAINDELTRIKNAKEAIKTSIEAKGVTVGNGTIDTYASKINEIPSGVDINEYYDLTKKTSGKFNSYIKQIPIIDTSDYTQMNYMFSDYSSLTTIPELNTTKVTNMDHLFSDCSSLTTIPQLDTSNVKNMHNIFYGCSKLTTLGGFTNLGQAYDTTQSANYSNYTLDLSSSNNLTHESLINVINNLYDIATKGCQPQKLNLGSTNKAKLTEDEIAIATNKGWTVI